MNLKNKFYKVYQINRMEKTMLKKSLFIYAIAFLSAINVQAEQEKEPTILPIEVVRDTLTTAEEEKKNEEIEEVAAEALVCNETEDKCVTEEIVEKAASTAQLI